MMVLLRSWIVPVRATVPLTSLTETPFLKSEPVIRNGEFWELYPEAGEVVMMEGVFPTGRIRNASFFQAAVPSVLVTVRFQVPGERPVSGNVLVIRVGVTGGRTGQSFRVPGCTS